MGDEGEAEEGFSQTCPFKTGGGGPPCSWDRVTSQHEAVLTFMGQNLIYSCVCVCEQGHTQ